MGASFFSRLTSYQPRQFLDPRENRLTELTAALLEKSTVFRHEFVAYLLRDEGDSLAFRRGEVDADLGVLQAAAGRSVGPAEIETQVSTLNGRFVDLSIRLAGIAGGNTGLLVWVEVKDGSDLHGDQLFAYADAITAAARGSSSCVVLLVPRGWVTVSPQQVPPSVLVADWTGVADVARKCAADEANDGLDRWLLDEYSEYLREEGLSDPVHKALEQDGVAAIASALSITDTKEALCREARRLLESAWGPVTREEEGRGKDFWCHFDPTRAGAPAAPSWHGAWFEFGLRSYRDLEGLEIDGEYAFMAGVVFPRGQAEPALGDESWLAGLANFGFRPGRIAGWNMVTRLFAPGDLLAESAFDAQASLLAAKVEESFSTLASTPPAGQ